MDVPAFVPLEHRILEQKNLAELFTECARDGHFLTVKGLIEEANVDVNSYNSLGLTAFQLAYWNKHFQLTELLIQKGAKNISTNFELNEPVIKASSFKDPILEQRRIQIEQSKYLDALIEYVRQGCLTIVTGLIEEVGVNINAANYFGLTPLMQAVKEGDPEIVELLIQKGVNVLYSSRHGCTALKIIAEDYCYTASDPSPNREKIMNILLNAILPEEREKFAGSSLNSARIVQRFKNYYFVANSESKPPLIFSNHQAFEEMPFPTPTPTHTPTQTRTTAQNRFGAKPS